MQLDYIARKKQHAHKTMPPAILQSTSTRARAAEPPSRSAHSRRDLQQVHIAHLSFVMSRLHPTASLLEQHEDHTRLDSNLAKSSDLMQMPLPFQHIHYKGLAKWMYTMAARLLLNTCAAHAVPGCFAETRRKAYDSDGVLTCVCR